MKPHITLGSDGNVYIVVKDDAGNRRDYTAKSLNEVTHGGKWNPWAAALMALGDDVLLAPRGPRKGSGTKEQGTTLVEWSCIAFFFASIILFLGDVIYAVWTGDYCSPPWGNHA